MRSEAEYLGIVETYRAMGAIADGSELRWDIRPSAAYPTIELRICDVCPRIEDAVAIAALYACLILEIASDIEEGKAPAPPPREFVEESRWLAQRYGTFAFLPRTRGVKHGPRGVRIPGPLPPAHAEGEAPSVAEVATELVSRLSSQARSLGCERALEHIVEIGERGSSAERQEDLYREAKLDGASETEALRAVVDGIIAETESTGD